MMFPYVALEGVNGAGKSSAREVLSSIFAEHGWIPFEFGQYGWLHPSASQTIVEFREKRRMVGRDELLSAHLIDRKLAQSEVLEPALAQGPVVGDRSLLSDPPYLQAMADIPLTHVLETYEGNDLLFPHLVILFDVEPDLAFTRVKGRSKRRKAYEDIETLSRVSAAYRLMAESKVLNRLAHVVYVPVSEQETSKQWVSDVRAWIARGEWT